MTTKAALALVVVLTGVAHAQPETSDTLNYRAKKGDTLEVIAAEFYGDRNHEIFIMVENHMQHARALQSGERLKIPVTREITTAKGDTFESLAGAYLGDPRRAPFLADFNAMSADDDPVIPTGTLLTIPFHVTHVAAGTETIAQIAAAYFGDSKQADVLRRYNFTDKTQLEKGESIVVPILNVRVRAGKLPPIDAESKQRRDAQHRAELDAAVALPRARAAWLAADFAGVKATLAALGNELDYLDTPTAVEIGVLLGKALVASDEVDLAVAKFTQVINRQPRRALSPYAESPTVIAAWKKAGGHVAGE